MKRFLKSLIIVLAVMLCVPYTNASPISTPLQLLGFAICLAGVICLLPNYRQSLPGVKTQGVNQEIWVQYIIARFWAANLFLKYAFNDDQYVIGGSLVHIPQAGAVPTVVKNRTVFPATAVQRADTDIVFALDTYTTDPTHITEADKVELSYDKMDSVMGDHLAVLNDTVAMDTIIKWVAGLPGASILKTTGAASAEATPDNATGTRKVAVAKDLKRLQKLFNAQGVPSTDRYAMFEANMLDQITESLTDTQYRDFSSAYDPATGTIGKLYGFNIVDRHITPLVSAGDVVNPLGAATAAGDNNAAIAWQKDSVTKAMGEVKVFDNPNRAEYYGDIISGLLRGGARRRRADNKGIAMLVAGA